MSKLRIGDKLIVAKLITEEQLAQALMEQKKLRDNGFDTDSTLIGIVLINLGFITKQQLLDNLF